MTFSTSNGFIQKNHMWYNQYSPCFCEAVASRRPATPSHKHGLCPAFRVSTGLHVKHRRPKAGDASPRAADFGYLITADHRVLREGCESRNNHRYAVGVQDLATQWIQSFPCKNKTSQETQRSLQKFLEPERKPKVIYTDNFHGIWQGL